MNTIYAIASQTPWWVYLLLFYLINIGIKATKPQVVSIQRLCILPLVFIVLSIHTILSVFHLEPNVIVSWLLSLAVGSRIGWLLVRHQKIQVDKKHLLIQLSGGWLTLTFILIIFASKYYFGYTLSADPLLVKQTAFKFSLLATMGICTGLFIGRVIFYLHRLRSMPSVDLSVFNKR